MGLWRSVCLAAPQALGPPWLTAVTFDAILDRDALELLAVQLRTARQRHQLLLPRCHGSHGRHALFCAIRKHLRGAAVRMHAH